MVSVRVTPSSERICADQPLERRGVRRLHLEQERVLAGHVVALEHVVERDDLPLELRRSGSGWLMIDADEGGDVEPEPRARRGWRGSR